MVRQPRFSRHQRLMCHCSFCGNSVVTPGDPAPNGEGCSMACAGAPGEACGGADRLSLYERTSAPPAQSSAKVIEDGSDFVWTALGCYSDLTYARILSQGVTVHGGGQNNSAASCTVECKRQDYIYAGTEYAGECFVSVLNVMALPNTNVGWLVRQYTQQWPW